eukprot:gene4363-6651_t
MLSFLKSRRRRALSSRYQSELPEKVQMMVFSWNLGNAAPPDDLSLMFGPRDRIDQEVIILGFQESQYIPSNPKEAIEKAKSNRPLVSTIIQSQRIQVYLGTQYHATAYRDLGQMKLAGGIGVKFSIGDVRIAVISTHLNAHAGEDRKLLRHKDTREILKGLMPLSNLNCDAYGAFHYIFWMGDMNYRLNLDQVSDLEAVPTTHIDRFTLADEFPKDSASGQVLSGFREGVLCFPPTFKMLREPGVHYRDQRIPAYCDRILWRTMPGLEDGIVQDSLEPVIDVGTSDHKPIRATFVAHVNNSIEKPLRTGRKLIIHLDEIFGQDLVSRDWNGTSDPFVTFQSPDPLLRYSGRKARRSCIKHGTLNPSWGAKELPRLALHYHEHELELVRSSFLTLVFHDWDRLSRNDYMGCAEVPLKNIDVDEPFMFEGDVIRYGVKHGTVTEHASSSMMGAEGFGSDSIDAVNDGMSNMSIQTSSGYRAGFLKRGTQDPNQILDVGSESDKIRVMKDIVREMASGVDQSEVFPHVVKCVASKSMELKKLVYMYLVRYAEEVPDVALLSISTFQKGLSDPNQLIRASSLRILSSVRIPDIVPIMLLSLKQAASDMSPYVRKTAAHALPKLYSLAPMEKESIMEILEKLLHDRTTMVIGSVLMAFEEIIPERLDLLHKHFRKLCDILIDVDEWGQIIIVNVLVRYCRANFVDPNKYGSSSNEDKFYEDDDDEDKDEESSGDDANNDHHKHHDMDADFRMFLRALQPLLLSRNSGVVMAVVQAYHHLAPVNEMSVVTRALLRLIVEEREIKELALTTVASLVQQRPSMFQPYIKSFFVRSDDPLQCKLLKLEILTTLVSDNTVAPILREFQEYVKHNDKRFVAQTIQCIGRCASSLRSVTESCLTGLMALLNNKDDLVVAESVVVIKKLLQLDPEAHKDIIVAMSKLAIKITEPTARASLLWIIGEYSEHVPKIAPDVLRQMAKTFPDEEYGVKLQIVNLAAKLFLTNPKQTKHICVFVLKLAKYDQSYDIRDRARMVNALLFTKELRIHKKSKRLFLSEKPAPNLRSTFDGSPCHGWNALPEFTEDPSDPLLRDVPDKLDFGTSKEFAMESDDSTSDDGSDSSSSSDSDKSSSSEEESGSDSESSDETSTSESESNSHSGESTSSGPDNANVAVTGDDEKCIEDRKEEHDFDVKM